MPQYMYRGRDKDGKLRVGQRFSASADALSADLIKEGIFPTQITPFVETPPLSIKIRNLLQGETLHLEELSSFSRQMQLLYQAGVPMVVALRQLSTFTRSNRLATALKGVIEHLEMGQDLATAMQQFPDTFSQLMVNIVQIGETTGHLGDAFGHLHKYLEFETITRKQLKTSFRYPIFVIVSIVLAVVVLNIFVIPSFARFYTNLDVPLPWQTQILISSSNFFVHYGLYLLVLLIVGGVFFYRYIRSPNGKYKWDRFLLHLPFIGKLQKRILLIRFSQSLAIVLNSGISVTQGLTLVQNLLNNSYINAQIAQMQEAIERGNTFTQAISKIEIFSPMELQILAVGEKNGELGPSLTYIGSFHSQEIQYDLKKLNDVIGPAMIAAISILILIMALGIYLPIWNMINLVH